MFGTKYRSPTSHYQGNITIKIIGCCNKDLWYNDYIGQSFSAQEEWDMLPNGLGMASQRTGKIYISSKKGYVYPGDWK